MTNRSVGNASRKLLILDGHALAFHSWFTSYPNEVFHGFFTMLEDSVEGHNPSHIIVTFDPPPPTFRHKLYPDYKANRPPAPEVLLEECEYVRDRLDKLGVTFRVVERYEADDVIGTLCGQASMAGFDTVILTSDLDLLQLVTPSTIVEVFSQYWPTRQFDVKAAKRRFGGIEPKNIPDYKALVGDRSDNLPGVPGIGETSASALLREYPDLDSVYKELDAIAELPFRGAKRVGRLLTEHRERAFLMRFLTTIVCDVPVDVDLDQLTIQETALTCNGDTAQIASSPIVS